MTNENAIPADINNPRSVASTLSDMIDMASQSHSDCDIDSDTECRGEQYGDGNAEEHYRLRDADATVKLLARKAVQWVEEIREAHSILADYHDKCYEYLGKTIDPNAHETEYCSSFQEAYGKEYDRITCYEHDKLREWTKLLKSEED